MWLFWLRFNRIYLPLNFMFNFLTTFSAWESIFYDSLSNLKRLHTDYGINTRYRCKRYISIYVIYWLKHTFVAERNFHVHLHRQGKFKFVCCMKALHFCCVPLLNCGQLLVGGVYCWYWQFTHIYMYTLYKSDISLSQSTRNTIQCRRISNTHRYEIRVSNI